MLKKGEQQTKTWIERAMAGASGEGDSPIIRAVGETAEKIRQDAPGGLAVLPAVDALRRIWSRHYERDEASVRPRELRGRGPDKGDSVESPYDVDALPKKRGTTWAGYMVHLTETCDEDAPQLVVHADTTPGDVHEARRTSAIHDALSTKGLAPSEHHADAAYISADLLVEAQEQYGIRLVGPPRSATQWQGRIEGGYTADRFDLDWEQMTVTCPQGQTSATWKEKGSQRRYVYLSAFGVGDDLPKHALLFRIVLRLSAVGDAYPDHAAAERVVEASGTRWTIVRPPGLTDADAAVPLVDRGDEWSSFDTASRRSVAEFMVSCVEADRFIGRVVTVGEPK